MSTRDTHTNTNTPSELDVLVVGAGFAGLYQLHNYQKLGYKVHLLESGNDIGGIWYWNCYPGARVDSSVPIYEYSMEELWKDWNWTELFPGWEELRAYFRFVDEKLGLKKDITFNAHVVGAKWNTEEESWTVRTASGLVVRTRFLILALGIAAKSYTPAFANLDSFQGICHHTSAWPEKLTSSQFVGKKVAVIGTGASGIQIIQEVGPVLGEQGHLTVFQRTPNFCLPMRQQKLSVEAQNEAKKIYPAIYKRRYQTHGGFTYGAYPIRWSSATPEERILRLEELWVKGSLEFITSNYVDLQRNQEVNDAVYAFWRDKVRSRIRDSRMQEKLAPTVSPHPLGAKRAALENTYYEVFNQPNVSLIDVNENPIVTFTSQGIVTQDGKEHTFDIVVLATGFDGVTGGITQIDIRGTEGRSIKDKWKEGVLTNLGMSTAGFPNLFFVYGPQGPTTFCNGPSCGEMQGDWIVRCIQYMKTHNMTRIEATHEAETEYKKFVLDASERIKLLKKAKSWWNGANIPGKVVEPLSFAGGVPAYLKRCSEEEKRGYEGFVLSSRSGGSKL